MSNQIRLFSHNFFHFLPHKLLDHFNFIQILSEIYKLATSRLNYQFAI